MNPKQKPLPHMPVNDSGVTTLDKSGRARRQFRFWLDAAKEDESAMGQALDSMKNDKTKNFAGFMRNAVRLMLALLAGDTSILIELFPNIVNQIKQEAIAENNSSSASHDFERMMQEISALKELVIVPVSHQIASNSGGLQPLGAMSGVSARGQIGGISGARLIAAPVFDDEDDLDLVVSKAVSDGKSTQNFLKSMMALQEVQS